MCVPARWVLGCFRESAVTDRVEVASFQAWTGGWAVSSSSYPAAGGRGGQGLGEGAVAGVLRSVCDPWFLLGLRLQRHLAFSPQPGWVWGRVGVNNLLPAAQCPPLSCSREGECGHQADLCRGALCAVGCPGPWPSAAWGRDVQRGGYPPADKEGVSGWSASWWGTLGVLGPAWQPACACG